MGVLTIDGVGRVEVGPEFARLTPEQQAATVQDIVAQIKGGPVPAAEQDATLQGAYAEEGRQALAAQGIRPEAKPDEIVERGTILPVGITGAGKPVLALPEFLEGPRRTVMDLLEGKRTIKEVSGKEIFELGALLAGGGGATGTGAGIARASAERSAAQVAERSAAAAPAAVNQTAKLATELAAEAAPAARAAAPAVDTAATQASTKAASKDAFRVADEAELVLSSQSFQPMVQAAQREAAKTGLDKTLTPDSVAALSRLTEVMNKPVAFQDLMTLREVASIAGGAVRPKDANIARGIIDRVDDYIAGLSAKDVFAGATDPQIAARALREAQSLWSKQAKLQDVAALVQRAQDKVTNRPSLGLENTLRTEFINLSTNKRAMARLTPDERAAVRAVTKGTVKTAARSVGRLAPTGPLSGMAAGGLAVGLGAKLGLDTMTSALVIAAPAFAARKLAAVLTQRSVKKLEDVIKAGSKSAMAAQSAARGRSLAEQLAGQINTAMQAQAVQPQDKPRRR